MCSSLFAAPKAHGTLIRDWLSPWKILICENQSRKKVPYTCTNHRLPIAKGILHALLFDWLWHPAYWILLAWALCLWNLIGSSTLLMELDWLGHPACRIWLVQTPCLWNLIGSGSLLTKLTWLEHPANGSWIGSSTLLMEFDRLEHLAYGIWLTWAPWLHFFNLTPMVITEMCTTLKRL